MGKPQTGEQISANCLPVTVEGIIMKLPAWWTLNKILVLLLLGAFMGLTLDLRYEHVDKALRACGQGA